MQQYEIEDFSSNSTFSLFADGKIIEAETGRKALDKYLKLCNRTHKVKVSASNDVQYKVQPVCFENGRKYLDRRRGQKAMWYQIQNN